MVVYRIIFPNNKCYVGITTNFDKRKQKHLWEAKRGNDRHLYRAIRKYGEGSLKWEILEKSSSWESLQNLEKSYIEKFNSFDNGYNRTLGGDGALGTTPWHAGTKGLKKSWNKGKRENSQVTKKRSKSIKKFYNSTENRNKNALSKGSKPFRVFKRNIIVGEWISKLKCSQDLEIPRIGIIRSLQGKYEEYKGYRFKYV